MPTNANRRADSKHEVPGPPLATEANGHWLNPRIPQARPDLEAEGQLRFPDLETVGPIQCLFDGIARASIGTEPAKRIFRAGEGCYAFGAQAPLAQALASSGRVAVIALLRRLVVPPSGTT
jgi:hypothetical protein